MSTPPYTILSQEAETNRNFYDQKEVDNYKEAPPAYEASQHGGPSHPYSTPGGPSYPYSTSGGPYEMSPSMAPPSAPYAVPMMPPYAPTVQQPQAPQVINVTCHTGGNGIQMPSSVSRDSMRLQCPSCRQHIKTNVSRKSVCKTHMCALLLCIFFCWPCACLPYCCASYRDAYHTCPNCEIALGVYRT